MLPQQQRRRRRRAVPRAAERRVTVVRGPGGFGFTIAGQRPCVVSAVAAGGPAETAGLRTGDALVAVDGASVARAPHAAVARLVAAAPEAIALSVAPREPPTDTEDTEPEDRARSRRRHPPPRRRVQPPANAASGPSGPSGPSGAGGTSGPGGAGAECRALLGYLGTISSPGGDAPALVKQAVRRLRQERRAAAPVLLAALPAALALRRPGGRALAQYPRERVVYAGCGADARHLGLVTAAEGGARSCHVFAADARRAPHAAHRDRAREFALVCTRDGSGRCLEFPASAEAVACAVRAVYGLPATDCASPALQRLSRLALRGPSPPPGLRRAGAAAGAAVRRARHSPQPSTHSEVTTASSNSDSGIGFHQDPGGGDRVLVVDFAPGPARGLRGAGPGPGAAGLEDGFLSNTRPVVDGFAGQGRPLGADDVMFADSFVYNGFGASTSRGAGACEAGACGAGAGAGACSPPGDHYEALYDEVDYDEVEDFEDADRADGCRSADELAGRSDRQSDGLSLDSVSLCSSRGGPRPDTTGATHDDDNFVHPASVKFKVKKHKSTLLAKTRGVFARRGRLSASVEDVCRAPPAAATAALAASEPDLRSEQTSPFRRWTSGGSSYRRECRPPTYAATMSGAGDAGAGAGGGAGGGGGGGGGGVARWALGLEHLLADPAGAAAFTQFLTDEFAAENIRFWCLCEQYREAGADAAARARLGADIWRRHLADAAPEPVNVDAAARRAAAAAAAGGGGADLFLLAQKQIFNVMKFDSYPRFLRSRVHAECARAELCGLPCPYLPAHTKLKKSDSTASERRRSGGASLLPWRLRPAGKASEPPEPDRASERAAGGERASERAAGVERASERAAGGERAQNEPDLVSGAPASLCRVLLPDGATSVVGLQGSEPVARLLARVLQRRRLPPASYDVIVQLQSESKLIAPSAPCSVLAGRTARVERRCSLRAECGGRAVRVRCAPARTLREALAPLAGGAGGGAGAGGGRAVVVSGGELVPPAATVEEYDGARLQIVMLSDDDASVPAHLLLTPAPAAPAAATAAAPAAPAPDVAVRLLDDADNKSVSSASSERGGRVRAALRPGPALQHHPADFLDNLRETQRLRLQGRGDARPDARSAADARAPPPLPPKPRPPPALV